MEPKTPLAIELVALDTAGEVAVLLDLAVPESLPAAHAVSLVIRPADGVPGFAVWNELPTTGVEDGVMIELGDVGAGERRRLLLSLEVPAELGLGTVCELELRRAGEQVATLPVLARSTG